MSDELMVEEAGGVVTVTFNRPDNLNTFTLPMYERFGAIFTELSTRDDVRCIVLTGTGEKGFCAGSDIGDFDGNRSGADQARDYAERTNRATDALRYCPHPTIARIRGLCVGGGLEIAAMCDVRIASTDSRFGLPINRIGLNVDYEELAPLCELVGRRTVQEILIEGRIFGAEEALTKGLVSRVLPIDKLDQEVGNSAERIARSAPLVNRWHKKFLRRMADPSPLSEEEYLECYRCYETEDYRIGTAAFLAKRQPEFEGR